MATATDDARATAFGTLVDAARYDEVRPEYPLEVVSWLVGDAAGPLRVLDLAAGTGKLTRVLRTLGHQVVAVDPSEAMLATLLASGGAEDPAVEVLTGTAEQVPLPDACVDAVTVGQAWHWMRPGAAVAEVARVLRPGGTLGLVWNARDTDVPWVAELDRLVSGGTPDAGGWPRVPAPLGGPGRERACFRTEQVLAGAADVAQLASTESAVAVRHDRDAVLRAVAGLAAGNARPDGSVVVPMVCHAFRYRRP